MEPNAKRRKLDDGVFVLDKLKGRVVLRIDGISECFKAKRIHCSKTVRIRGLDWTLFVRSVKPYSGPINGFEFCIDCDDDSEGPDWNCAISVTLLCTSGNKEVEMRREDDAKFVATSTNVTWISTVSI